MLRRSRLLSRLVVIGVGLFSFCVGAAPTFDNTLYISGAVALDRTLFEAILDQTNGVCDDINPITVYSTATSAIDRTPRSYGNFMVHCTARDTATFGVGTEIGISKSSQGSDFGIYPVSDGGNSFTYSGAVVFVTAITTTCSGSNLVDPQPANVRLGYTHYYGCATSTLLPPQVGISDVEPALMGASKTVRERLTSHGAATVPYTMLVSKNFYRALQSAQGLTGACATDTAATQADACTPSLSMLAVRAILSSYTYSVSGLYAGLTPLSSPVGGDYILVCRRSNNTGAQKAIERIFFNQNCSSRPAVTFTSDAGIVNASRLSCLEFGCAWTNAAPTAVGGVAENFVFQGAGTGDVESCMNWATGTFIGAGGSGGTVDAGQGVYAVGISSADRTPNDIDAISGKQYRYIKIDGVVPTVENVVAGKWQHIIENTVLTPTPPSPNYRAFQAGLRPKIFGAMLAQLRVPSNYAKSHSTVNAIGRIGLLARPSASQAPEGTDIAPVRPLAPFLRASSRVDTPVNNCNELSVPYGDPVKLN